MNPTIELKARRIAFWLSAYYIVETSLLRNFLGQPKVRRQLLADVLLGLAISASIIGTLQSVRDYNHNAYVNAMASHAVAVANAKSKSSKNSSTLQPGAAPSTTTPQVPSNVATGVPEELIIPKINVDTSIVTVGLDSDGSIGTPSNVYQAAWYDQSATPGQEGAALIDGHISSWTADGVFYNLNKLASGDTVQVRFGSGETISYSVVKTVVYSGDDVDMSSVLSPYVPNTKALNLISCYGSVISGTNEFNERIVVYTEQT